MKEGGYDQKVNETVNVVSTKTTEIGAKTWGIMKGVMAMASQKVEEYAKEGGIGWKGDDWQRKEPDRNGYYQEFNQESNGWNNSEDDSRKRYNSVSSWDDWDNKEKKAEPEKTGGQSSDSWAGWDDVKDDGYENYSSSSNKGNTRNGKSGSLWTDGGFL